MIRKCTRLPPTIKKIIKQQAVTTYKISEWLRGIGCGTSWIYDKKNRSKKKTTLDIRIRHESDYISNIDCNDPSGKMFYIITTENIGITFPSYKMRNIVTTLEDFSKGKIKVKELGNKVYLHFFEHERAIDTDWWKASLYNSILTEDLALKMILKFDIYTIIK